MDLFSEEARANRRQLLLVSVLLTLVLVMDISISTLSVFGIDISFDKRQLLAALTVAGLYFNVYFSILAARDFNRSLHWTSREAYQSGVSDPVDALSLSACDAVAGTDRLSLSGRQELLAHVIFLRMNIKLAQDPVGENADDAKAGDAERMRTYERISNILAELHAVEPERAARIRITVERMLQHRSDFILRRLESSQRTREGWFLATYFPVFASSLLTMLCLIALFRPDLSALLVDLLSGLPASADPGPASDAAP